MDNALLMTLVLCALVGGHGASSVIEAGSLRDDFLLEENLVFLNHGSFGATPRRVLEAEFELAVQMERDPMEWMNTKRVPMQEHVQQLIAEYIGARCTVLSSDPAICI